MLISPILAIKHFDDLLSFEPSKNAHHHAYTPPKLPFRAPQPYTPGLRAEGELHLQLTYKPFEDDEHESEVREAEAYAQKLQEQAITDIKSAAGGCPISL